VYFTAESADQRKVESDVSADSKGVDDAVGAEAIRRDHPASVAGAQSNLGATNTRTPMDIFSSSAPNAMLDN
jgi:hypothetical protein